MQMSPPIVAATAPNPVAHVLRTIALVVFCGLAPAAVTAQTDGQTGVIEPPATAEIAQDSASQPAREVLGGLARLAGTPEITTGWRRVEASLSLTQPVPWRTRLMSDPPRAVIDFRTLDWTGFEPASIVPDAPLVAVRVGQAGGGWSRIVFEFDQPMAFSQAGLQVNPETGGAAMNLRFDAVSAEDFAAQAAALGAQDPDDATAEPFTARPDPALGLRRTRVVLDPGHGGLDSGARHGGVHEADLMLTFARELAEVLRRTGRYEVHLSRDADVFVSLEARITVAHSTQADLFLSLHADALEGPQANGATVYTLSEAATDAASAALAERHDRDDLLGDGVDLSGSDDVVASVLMDLARAQTMPATDQFARALVGAIQAADLRMHRHPWQQAAFSVLKSPTVPSILLEVGFLSSEHDRARLQDPEWRARMQQALLTGMDAWVVAQTER